MAERAPNEVWVEIFRTHAYVRVGPKANLATVNYPKMAECVRDALQAFVDRSANGNESEKEIGK